MDNLPIPWLRLRGRGLQGGCSKARVGLCTVALRDASALQEGVWSRQCSVEQSYDLCRYGAVQPSTVMLW